MRISAVVLLILLVGCSNGLYPSEDEIKLALISSNPAGHEELNNIVLDSTIEDLECKQIAGGAECTFNLASVEHRDQFIKTDSGWYLAPNSKSPVTALPKP